MGLAQVRPNYRKIICYYIYMGGTIGNTVYCGGGVEGGGGGEERGEEGEGGEEGNGGGGVKGD